MRDKWFGPLQLSHLALKIWFIYFSIIWLSIFDIYTGWPGSTGLNGCLYKQEQGQIASSETMFPTICETEGGWFNVPYKSVQKKWGRGRRHYPRRLECLSFADVTAKAAYFPQLFKMLFRSRAWTLGLPQGITVF